MPELVRNGKTTALGDGVLVTRSLQGHQLTVVIEVATQSDCILHWGIRQRPGEGWRTPPSSWWPAGTTAVDGNAVETPFSVKNQGKREVKIGIAFPVPARQLVFVLHFPNEKRWQKNGDGDFAVSLPRSPGDARPPESALSAWAPGEGIIRETKQLDSGESLAVATTITPESVRVQMACDAALPLVLQWGLAWRFRNEWRLPPENYRTAATTQFDQQAVRTPFVAREGLAYLELEFARPAEGNGPLALQCVLFQPEESAWLKSGGKDLSIPLFRRSSDPRLGSTKLQDLAEEIVAAEIGAPSWTLMHRFNLCTDLLSKTENDPDALALLFAWLRYSRIRQLDWQRRYNTKPRELSHAQGRLTTRLAGIYRGAKKQGEDRQDPEASVRTWARLMLSTLGRGGEGQQVRDEILHIMHRNNLKETSGSFMEEWHQKLHNNTSPDDVVICQAFLAFLRSNGDLAQFNKTLEAGGVTRDRLKSYERPIKTDPHFFPDHKEALITDFENFLQILNSVHSGTDFQSAVTAARGRLGEALNKQLDQLLASRQKGDAMRALLPVATSVKEGLKDAIASASDDQALCDLLFLDLALEEVARSIIERQNLSELGRDDLVVAVHCVLRYLSLSMESRELELCTAHWASLLEKPREGKDWSLHALSVADRAGRWVQEFTTQFHDRLQPKAEFLGEAFEVASWTIPLFSEEVIRGGAVFILSLLLRPLDSMLRKATGLGGWQIISSAPASGRLRVVNRLLDVQGETFPEPTVLVVDEVSGLEEIPNGVTAILTSDTPDLVSHVAVRARNARILFASCFDTAMLERLKSQKDKSISLQVTPGGDVEYKEAQAGNGKYDEEQRQKPRLQSTALAPGRSRSADVPWVISQDQFTPEIVGGKANNLNGLRGRLPDWIVLPASLALPFGICEKTLQDRANEEIRRQTEALTTALEGHPSAEDLSCLRGLLEQLVPPSGLKEALLQAWNHAGLPSEPWESVWSGIRKVWASKWNDRAYYSRRARAFPHDSLYMAVLIQQVVEADYAFVIHTTNPLTGNRDELFAEVVLGMGETLVGNYPGRALGFVCRKADGNLELLSYPSKSLGLYGKGVIFRSDSNGEDLADFAGAGLYDSFLAQEPAHRVLDYRGEKLVWDQAFREDLLHKITRVGVEVEKLLGSPQDIEGAVANGTFHVVQTRPQVGLAR